MKFSNFIGFSTISLTMWQLLTAASYTRTESTSVDSEVCFESFGERTTNAAHTYAENYDRCEHQGFSRRAWLTREKETEREQIENGTAQICDSMQNCNKLEAHEGFFDCHAAASSDNIDILISIHLNASAVVIDLSTQYEQAEKEVRLCKIEAQREYTVETRVALKELKMCLEP